MADKEFHVVLKRSDGFQKEETRYFENDAAPQKLRTRKYDNLQSLREQSMDGFYRALPCNTVRAIDTDFRLRFAEYALGKNIAFYEETK
jgi:hypothetical protein